MMRSVSPVLLLSLPGAVVAQESGTPSPDLAPEAAPVTDPVETAPTGDTGGSADAAPSVDTAPSVETVPAVETPEVTPVIDGVAPGSALDQALRFLVDGGPAIWVIAALSVLTAALILWKLWRLFRAGAWSRKASFRAVELWEAGRESEAVAIVGSRKGLRSKLTHAAMLARHNMSDDLAREETVRVAKRQMADQSAGLRALELIATIAPLLGLLGTVLGMISAFQALQEAGSRADPAMLAGGIWEALLTTAAGMAVAIPASAALTWFESVIESVRADMEDIAARIFVTPASGATQEAQARVAAE